MEIGADWAVCVRARSSFVFSLARHCSSVLRLDKKTTWNRRHFRRLRTHPLLLFSSFLSLSLTLFRFGRLTTSTTPGRPLITRAQSAVAAAAVKATHINRLSLSLPKSIKLYVSNYTLQRNSIQIWNEFGAPSLRMINAYQNKKKKEKMHTNNHVTVSYARNRGGCYAIG